MTVEDNRALGYRVYEAINAQDLATLDKLFTPDIIRHAMGEIGIEAAKRATTNAFKGFPETRFVVEDLFAEGDKVALRVTVHRPGESLLTLMEIFRIENGRVAEIWGAGIRQPAAK